MSQRNVATKLPSQTNDVISDYQSLNKSNITIRSFKEYK